MLLPLLIGLVLVLVVPLLSVRFFLLATKGVVLDRNVDADFCVIVSFRYAANLSCRIFLSSDRLEVDFLFVRLATNTKTTPAMMRTVAAMAMIIITGTIRLFGDVVLILSVNGMASNFMSGKKLH